MQSQFLQSLVARLPSNIQFTVRRRNFARQIRAGRFVPDEPELVEVGEVLRPGDWAIDIGANVGRYTCYMANRVGLEGRVLAFEPIAESFAMLVANVRAARAGNVSLFNLALSARTGVQSMTVPQYAGTKLRNYYAAHLATEGEHRVLCLPLDALPIPSRVSLVKIDTEGHEVKVLEGMQALLRRDRPLLIVEGGQRGPSAEWLRALGYEVRKNEGSPNIVARASGMV